MPDLEHVMTWLAERRKAVAAAVTAGLIAAQTVIPMSPMWHALVTVAIAVLTIGAVHQIPNAPTVAQQEETNASSTE